MGISCRSESSNISLVVLDRSKILQHNLQILIKIQKFKNFVSLYTKNGTLVNNSVLKITILYGTSMSKKGSTYLPSPLTFMVRWV